MGMGRIAVYLITLAAGYWVLTLAEKEKGFHKKLGRVLGWVIVAVSLAGPLCLAASRLYYCGAGQSCYSQGACPWSGHGDMDHRDGMPGDQEKGK